MRDSPLARDVRWSNDVGAIALIAGILATVVVAIVGLGIDVVAWYRDPRALQNAARCGLDSRGALRHVFV